MKTLTKIVGKVMTLIIKSKPTGSSKSVIGYIELRAPYLMNVEAPIISLNNNRVPFGIPASIEKKYSDSEGDWHTVGGYTDDKGVVVLPYKWQITAKARLYINLQISNFIRKNPDLFGITPKVDLVKEPTTKVEVPKQLSFDEELFADYQQASNEVRS